MPILVSFAAGDRPWAQWLALELRAAGHDVRLLPAGVDFAFRITAALSGPDRLLLLISAELPGADAVWARLLRDPARAARVVPLRLDHSDPPPALRALGCHNLSGLDEEEVVETLLAVVGRPPPRGDAAAG